MGLCCMQAPTSQAQSHVLLPAADPQRKRQSLPAFAEEAGPKAARHCACFHHRCRKHWSHSQIQVEDGRPRLVQGVNPPRNVQQDAVTPAAADAPDRAGPPNKEQGS